MKRIIISVVLLLICVVGAIAETSYISGSVDGYTQTIDDIDGYMLRDDFENALAQCSELNDNWADSAHGIDALLIHDYVDGIGFSLSQMKSYIESGNPSMYFSESEKAKKALASIKDSEYPFVENIL